VNEKLRAFLMFPPGFALLGALVAAPHIVHLLDRGSATGTVGQIARGELPSRNVTVNALVHADRGVRLAVQEKDKEAKVSFFMPICDQGSDQEPTQLVVHSYYNEVFDAVERPDEPMRFEGTVRDVLWEGLDSETKELLAEAHPLAPNVKLLELSGTSRVDDWLWGYGAPMAGLLFGLLAASGTQAKPPAQGKPETPA
jgi:hypothetical protein